MCLNAFKDKKSNNLNSIWSIAELIVNEKLKNDNPQIDILMKIYLEIPETSVAAEREFSVLKRIKLWLRNLMGQERLSSLSFLSIERDLVKNIIKDDLIDQFAAIKDRRMQFF